MCVKLLCVSCPLADGLACGPECRHLSIYSIRTIVCVLVCGCECMSVCGCVSKCMCVCVCYLWVCVPFPGMWDSPVFLLSCVFCLATPTSSHPAQGLAVCPPLGHSHCALFPPPHYLLVRLPSIPYRP